MKHSNALRILYFVIVLFSSLCFATKSFSQEKLTDKDIATIEQVTGMKGKANNGEYKITVPQNDLKVEVDGFKIIPPMGLSTWIAFSYSKDGAMLMGDIIMSENDVKPVQQEVIKQGLTISAIHNHFIRNHPNVVFMHVGGSGSVDVMAAKAKDIFAAVTTSRGHNPAASPADSVVTSLDAGKLDTIIGSKGEWNKGVYKYTIGRPDISLKEHGLPVSTFMGFNTWAAWQGTPDHAAVAGDFAMLEDEVAPVIKALIEHGIEVVAVHNHMVHEQPRIFYLHYWGTGNAEQLANGLKAALNETGKKHDNEMHM